MRQFLEEVTKEFEGSVECHNNADPKLKVRQERFRSLLYKRIMEKVETAGGSADIYADKHKTEMRYRKFYEYFVKP